MREVLLDITNIANHSANAEPSTSKLSNGHSSRPKLLRQTSLLAFAAPKSSSDPASRLSSPLISSSSSTCGGDEGYSSVVLNSDDSLDNGCEEEQEASSSSSSKRVKLSSEDAAEAEEVDEEQEVVDEARRIRRERLLARNRGLAAHQSLDEASRMREYAANPLQSGYLRRNIGTYCNEQLDSYVSHYSRDVFRSVSRRSDRDYSPPFACVFSNASKRNGKKVLAVADEEGTVTILDAERKETDACSAATSFHAHDNAVFDLRWSGDDRQLATASGDQTINLTDVETRKKTATLRVHTCSVKQIAYDPHNPHLLASASRDGSIAIWDQRVQPQKGSTSLSPVNHIRFAHNTYSKSRKGKEASRSSTRSPTSIVYLQHQENLLASGGSADGVVKVWDLRKTVSRRINPPSMEETLDFTSSYSLSSSAPPSSSNSRNRSHGIASLCLSPDGSRLYALSTNSKIYVHDPHYLSRPLHAPMHVFSAPSFLSSSFYVRLSISPDGRYLASGSSGMQGGDTHIWDLHTVNARKIYGETREASTVLKGHTAEVGGMDWANDTLATCGDDNLVRLWRPSAKIAEARRQGSEEHKWHYSGSWTPRDSSKATRVVYDDFLRHL